MYNDAYWPSLAEALAAAEDGDANQLLALFDDYYERDAATAPGATTSRRSR